jgi:hypothetical protein
VEKYLGHLLWPSFIFFSNTTKLFIVEEAFYLPEKYVMQVLAANTDCINIQRNSYRNISETTFEI